MNDVAKSAATAFDVEAWKEELLALNPWARGLTIDDDDEAFREARQKATLARYAQGNEIWNSWANAMLGHKKSLEAARRWAAKRGARWKPLTGENSETRA